MATATPTSIYTFTPDAASPGTGINRSRKRVLTEARREQNRVNQRSFRQKQREQRRQGSQHRYQHSSVKKPSLQPRPTHPHPGSEDTSVNSRRARTLGNTLSAPSTGPYLFQDQRTPLDNIAAPQVVFPPSTLDPSCTLSSERQPTSDLENITEVLFVPTSTSGPPTSNTDPNLPISPSGFDFSSLGSHGDVRIGRLDSDEESPRALDPFESRYLSRADGAWSPARDLHYLPDIPAEAPPKDIFDVPNDQSRALVNRSFDIESVIAAGLEVLLCGRRSESTSQEVLPFPQLPSPHRNCITFYPNKFVLACIQNAQSMGFLAQDVIMPRCLAQSPFYRRITAADDPKQLLAALTRPSTPVSLKPTLPQLLYPHPAFMDLIPMPVFRARAITLAATRPHLVNMTELKKDMVVEDGLVLWSPTSSSVSSHQRDGRGQPWDIRSWEAAPWFLRKWRMLVDGEGEVWKQSLWWQTARGES